MRAPWIHLALLFAAAALLSAITVLDGVNPHDEGLMLQAGARVASGELPYHDFYLNYGPAQPLVLGGLDLALGPNLLAWRIMRVLLDAGVALLVYLVARRQTDGEAPALLAWLAAAASMSILALPSPFPAALALALGAVLLARAAPLWAGVLAGLALAFRIDLGLAAAAGALIAAWPEGRGAVGRVGMAVAATALVVVGPFVVLGGPGRFWDQTLGFALDEQGLQRLPLPGGFERGLDPNGLLDHFFPYVLLGGLALWAVAAVRRRPSPAELAPLPLALAGALYLLARVDGFHRLPLEVGLAALLGASVGGLLRAGRRGWAVALALPLALVALQGLDQKRLELVSGPPLVAVEGQHGVRAPRAEAHALNELRRLVDARVPEGEPVFVANPRHDLVRVGDPLVYVVVDRPNPTRYDVMQPGVVTTAGAQSEMVADLLRTRPELVVRWLSPVADQAEPNGAGRSSGVRILDRYLARAYRSYRRIGDFEVLRLRRAQF